MSKTNTSKGKIKHVDFGEFNLQAPSLSMAELMITPTNILMKKLNELIDEVNKLNNKI